MTETPFIVTCKWCGRGFGGGRSPGHALSLHQKACPKRPAAECEVSSLDPGHMTLQDKQAISDMCHEAAGKACEMMRAKREASHAS